MKRAIIFGVSGQDGAFLAQLLLGKNYRVIGVSRTMRTDSFHNLELLNIRNKIELVSSSIHDFRSVFTIMNRYKPDEVYNLAGQSSVARSFDEPFETFESISVANLNLLEVIRILKLPVRLYNAGSGDCFGNMDGQTACEETPFRPQSPYGVAKSAAYFQVANYRKAYDIFACTGILFNHESYLRPEEFVTQKIVKAACLIAKGQADELLLGNISIERDWGWAPEYVTAMWMMLQTKKADDYIIATGITLSLKEFIAVVFDYLDLNWKKYVKTDDQFLRPTDIQTIRANPGKAEKKLNWKARYNGYDVARMMVDAELKYQKK
ncbi:GDP-mannose 4,6-dehydratase [Desulfobacula toluolica]|uniref:GDP-mannose 4,6-dehydratase n=1 Tax=Desulfobacula toluolica (strain DSM 7467 / Tol2) TaxID=651182 RepID=K0NFB0_DESTT|nr:GDP-mannose 4,6-dehydratase [Desulfobacula toluolica]CCK79570.1 Gca: GDP-mannose 4,6-dehydratase [Desulfobacula toluolica Tol2]